MIHYKEEGLVITSFPMAGTLVLTVSNPEKFDELHKYLNRALNTADDAPAWLFKLCDYMETKPIPERMEPPKEIRNESS